MIKIILRQLALVLASFVLVNSIFYDSNLMFRVNNLYAYQAEIHSAGTYVFSRET